MKKTILFTAAFIAIAMVSCLKTNDEHSRVPVLPSTPYNYMVLKRQNNNQNIKQVIKDESRNTINDHSVTLGRVLFYDKNLSINNTTSCGSCHIQKLAFSDGVALSKGFKNLKTPRNSMAILNPILNNNMFWDSRASSPLELSLEPVFNHLEMGMQSKEMLVEKLSSIDYYKPLFQNAFNTTTITTENISLALTHFLHSLFSENSKFDQGIPVNFSNFTPVEKLGKDLFFSAKLKCGQCHSGSNFSAPDFVGGPYGDRFGGGDTEEGPRGTANIGLNEVYRDNGRGDGKFKIPSLRNIELTGPYMHDGRFATLLEVINHYDQGVQAHPALDNKFLVNGKPIKLNLTSTEKFALIEFLKTLTDHSLLSDIRFSDPFVQ